MSDTLKIGELKSTGQLRSLLANAARCVLEGTLELEKATMLHKLSKNISDSLYSETKIAMYRKDAGMKPELFGKMKIGDPSEDQ